MTPGQCHKVQATHAGRLRDTARHPAEGNAPWNYSKSPRLSGQSQVLKVPVVGFSTTLLSIAPGTMYTRHELREPLYLSQLRRMVVRPR